MLSLHSNRRAARPENPPCSLPFQPTSRSGLVLRSVFGMNRLGSQQSGRAVGSSSVFGNHWFVWWDRGEIWVWRLSLAALGCNRLGWPKRFVDWDNKSVVCFLACWGEDYKLSYKGMQIAGQTVGEGLEEASNSHHLCGSLLLFLPFILCFSIRPNNCEGVESSHCIHPKSMDHP